MVMRRFTGREEAKGNILHGGFIVNMNAFVPLGIFAFWDVVGIRVIGQPKHCVEYFKEVNSSIDKILLFLLVRNRQNRSPHFRIKERPVNLYTFYQYRTHICRHYAHFSLKNITNML